MGGIVVATCPCGTNGSIRIGSGMAGPRPCYFPCLCEHCFAVVEVDLLAKRKECPQCKSTKILPYDDPTLTENAGKGRELTSWDMEEYVGRNLILRDKNYKCPQCGQLSLRFAVDDAHWD